LQDWSESNRDFYNSIELVRQERENVSDTGEARIQNICRARNLIASKSVNELVFIDSDCGATSGSLERLLEMRSRPGVGIAGGVTIGSMGHTILYAGWGESKPFTVTSNEVLISAFRKNRQNSFEHAGINEGENIVRIPLERMKIWDVDIVGMGLSVIAPEIYKRFQFEPFHRGPDGALWQGEDLSMCFKAAQHGFKVLADLSLIYAHWKYRYSVDVTTNGAVFKVEKDARSGNLLQENQTL
jgi:hypothetical protein